MHVYGKYGLLLVQMVGFVVSLMLVAITFAPREQVEMRLQGFAIAKVEAATNTALDAAEGNVLSGSSGERLRALGQRFGIEAEGVQQKREAIVPALMAYALSDRCGENCGFAGLMAVAADSLAIERIAQLRFGQATVQDFIVGRYEATVRGLILDLRRFGMVNVVVFALMMGLIVFRNHLNWRFAALSVAMTGYAAWASYGYIYGQNWALSILFQDWAAPGYQVAMIFMAALFSDWLFLRGWITRITLEAIASVARGVG